MDNLGVFHANLVKRFKPSSIFITVSSKVDRFVSYAPCCCMLCCGVCSL